MHIIQTLDHHYRPRKHVYLLLRPCSETALGYVMPNSQPRDTCSHISQLWRCYVVFNSNNFILLCSIPLIANLSMSDFFHPETGVLINTFIVLGAMGAKSYVLHREDLLMQNGLYLTAFISVSLAVNVSCCGKVFPMQKNCFLDPHTPRSGGCVSDMVFQ
jgi:hypothetical protein